MADIVRQDPRFEVPSPAVPPYIVEDAEEPYGGAVRGHPDLVGRLRSEHGLDSKA